jgi:hypothetical protein
MPESAKTPEAHGVEIEIEHGELETQLDRIHSHGGHVRLRIRSDQTVLVEIGDYGLSQPVPAGAATLVKFDTLSTRGLEVELGRRNGVLVLYIHD